MTMKLLSPSEVQMEPISWTGLLTLFTTEFNMRTLLVLKFTQDFMKPTPRCQAKLEALFRACLIFMAKTLLFCSLDILLEVPSPHLPFLISRINWNPLALLSSTVSAHLESVTRYSQITSWIPCQMYTREWLTILMLLYRFLPDRWVSTTQVTKFGTTMTRA